MLPIPSKPLSPACLDSLKPEPSSPKAAAAAPDTTSREISTPPSAEAEPPPAKKGSTMKQTKLSWKNTSLIPEPVAPPWPTFFKCCQRSQEPI